MDRPQKFVKSVIAFGTGRVLNTSSNYGLYSTNVGSE